MTNKPHLSYDKLPLQFTAKKEYFLMCFLRYLPAPFFGLLCLVFCTCVHALPVQQISPLALTPGIDSESVLTATAHLEADPNASAVLLLDEARTVIYPNFISVARYHAIIKLLDLSAVRRYTEFPLSRPTPTAVATVEAAQILKADGTVENVTDKNNHTSIVFPLLSPGDTLDISYQVKDHSQLGLPHQFWAAWTFTSDTPSLLSRYVLITPCSLKLTTRDHGDVLIPTVRDSGIWRIREWRMTDLPAHPSELLGAPENDSGIWLDISTLSSWSQIVRWYEGLSAPRCVPDVVVRAKAAALTRSAATETEKIQALQEFVTHKIQYQNVPFRLSAYVPAEGKEVLRRGYGDAKDKSALFSALLAAVGVKSDLVLLSSRAYGLTPYLPSPRFGHVIVRVEAVRFVDTAADLIDFGDLPIDDQQVPALVIAPGTIGLSETPVLATDGTLDQEIFTGTLSADGSLRGTDDWTLTGRQAWGTRLALRGVPEAHREEALHSLGNHLVKNAVFQSDSVEHFDEPSLPLVLHFTLRRDHDSISAGSFLLLSLPWNGQTKETLAAALLAEPKHTQDLEVAASRVHTHCAAQIHLPTGYAPQELPADVHQETPFGTLQTHYEIKGDLLTATRDVTLTALRVPAQNISDYAAFLKAIDEETSRQLIFKKP